MNPNPPLRYKISSWKQLPKCRSNFSGELKLSVSNLIQDARLTGLRIELTHTTFGVLFACVIDAVGAIVDPTVEPPELTPTQILTELAKFGFLIEYDPSAHLPASQISYLITLRGLHYDKLRILRVWRLVDNLEKADVYVVAFNSEANGNWLNNDYSPKRSEYLDALANGSAINISAISQSQRYNWSWLYGFVANIDDILANNVEGE